MNKKARTFLCKNHPDLFCFVCGQYIPEKKWNCFLTSLQKSYQDCYNIYLHNLNQHWTPSTICKSCQVNLSMMPSDVKRHLKISKPMLWREAESHESDCYFCLSTKSGFGKHLRWSYPTRCANGFTLAVLHSPGIEYAQDRGASCSQVLSSSPGNPTSSMSYQQDSSEHSTSENDEFITHKHFSPRPWNQEQLNDVIRDLKLSKRPSEDLLGKHWLIMKQYVKALNKEG